MRWHDDEGRDEGLYNDDDDDDDDDEGLYDDDVDDDDDNNYHDNDVFSHYLLCSHAKVVGKLKGLVRVVEDEVCCITSIDAYSTQ